MKIFLFVAIVVLPAIVAAVTVPVTFERAKTVEFCSSCHVMTPYVEDLKNPDSGNLAAMHFDRRWIAHDQCYTCHTDYVWFGTISAKMKGMRHVMAYYLAPERREIELYEPFPNENCLQCHGGARGFRDNPVHEAIAEDLADGRTICTECHAPIHPEDGDRALAEEDAENAQAGDDERQEAGAGANGAAGTEDGQ